MSRGQTPRDFGLRPLNCAKQFKATKRRLNHLGPKAHLKPRSGDLTLKGGEAADLTPSRRLAPLALDLAAKVVLGHLLRVDAPEGALDQRELGLRPAVGKPREELLRQGAAVEAHHLVRRDREAVGDAADLHRAAADAFPDLGQRRVERRGVVLRVFDEEGRALKIAFNLKTSGGVAHGESEAFRLFHTDETDLPLPQGLTTLESFYKHFAAAVGGMTTSPDESLRGLDARHYRLESLNAHLAEIARKISKEKQLDRKYALVKEKQRIERELGRVVP